MYKDDQGRVQSKKKPNKKEKKEEGKKGLMAMYDSDVHVADVLSYRYSANIQNLISFYYYWLDFYFHMEVCDGLANSLKIRHGISWCYFWYYVLLFVKFPFSILFKMF